MSIYVICLSHIEIAPKCRFDYLTTNYEHNRCVRIGSSVSVSNTSHSFFQIRLRNVYFANIVTVRPDSTLRTDHRDQLYYILRPRQLNRKKFYSLDKGQEFVYRVLRAPSWSFTWRNPSSTIVSFWDTKCHTLTSLPRHLQLCFLACVSPHICKCILNKRALSVNHEEILISDSLVEAGIDVVSNVSMLWSRGFRVSIPTRERHFLASRTSIQVPWPKQPVMRWAIQWVPWFFSGCKTAGSWI
jgi:hypothetical protein